jgi:hypothetical protein
MSLGRLDLLERLIEGGISSLHRPQRGVGETLQRRFLLSGQARRLILAVGRGLDARSSAGCSSGAAGQILLRAWLSFNTSRPWSTTLTSGICQVS